ncbi:adhesion G protein-coupled receptor F5-like [Mastacembelus armatus]|uniref:adhesion G protein-coupled receptor F5-like n=1 Tax=Mastacembelus armatus TaxID=205130 RepID=UPI000E46198B|nr:adhesion G protein-coupled receptor F5-like [Mastacembelus armatus]
MALLRTIGYTVVILAMLYSLEKWEYRQSLSVFFKEEMDTDPSHTLVREKRVANFSPSYYTLEAVINTSQLDSLRTFLRTLRFPIHINNSLEIEITSIDVTTVCSSNMTGYQCRCEEGFAWSYNNCINHQACDTIVGDTCGCISGLPADDQYCMLNSSKPVLDFELVIDLRFPVSSAPSNIIDQFRSKLRNFTFPHYITQSLAVTDLNFTTGCYPNSTGGLQCQCEEQFAWSCDMCKSYGACRNDTTQTCRCINGLPPNQFCEPITNTSLCVTPTTVLDFELVIDLRFPVSSAPSNIIDQFRSKLRNFTFPHYITQSLAVTDLNFTTGCYPNSTGGLQCQCEEQFAWSCDMCKSYGACRNDTTQTCRCINGLPPNQFCEPITNTSLCVTPTTVLDFELVIDLRFPVSSAPSNIIDQFRSKLRNFTFPHYITQSLAVTDLNFTTGCYPNSTGGLQCQCEEQFAWSCDMCKSYGACRNDTTQTCRCINGLPPNQFCEPITNTSLCVTPTTGYTTTTLVDTCVNKTFICQVKNFEAFKSEITLEQSTEDFECQNYTVYGYGKDSDRVDGPCAPGMVGQKTAVCRNKQWQETEDNCVLKPIQDLFEQSKFVNEQSLPEFFKNLSDVTVNFTDTVVESAPTIKTIVQILNNVANQMSSLNLSINNTIMKDVLITAGVLTINETKKSWDRINSNDNSQSSNNSANNKSVSSQFLQSLENITRRLINSSADINTSSVLLKKTAFNNTFNASFDSSVEIKIPEAYGGEKFITVITFKSMDNVLPARDQTNSTLEVINGRVVLVQSSGSIKNISLTFNTINNNLEDPQCVFWNFSLFTGLGGWDDGGCELVSKTNETVTCTCDHLTSFSILMSPNSPDDPVLKYITYVGVGISIGSLVICLIIEAVIWRKIRRNNTSYLRHVSIVNIAVSLLIADIWFIVGAAISDGKEKPLPACTAVTFFIHFFYLALFFWMLASGLLLLYRTVSVFDVGLSKKSMLAIGFSLGYGAPLIIVIITISVTAHKLTYIRQDGGCWLDWDKSKALLAFVIPALMIVLINLIILLVVLYKMLRRRAVVDTAQAAERHALVVIARTLAVLTPLFGLTWGLGVGTMAVPYNRGTHISFAFFNSLQGFFILVFGTLLDKKVRSEISLMSQSSRSGTRSTSAGTSSTSRLGFFRNLRRRRDGYHISSSDHVASSSSVNT